MSSPATSPLRAALAVCVLLLAATLGAPLALAHPHADASDELRAVDARPSAAERALSPAFGEIHPDDREAFDTLMRAPADLREAAFEAAAHPKVLLAVTEVQSRSSGDFAELVEDLPREEQEQLYELARYPEIVEALASGRRKSDREIDALTEGVPSAVRDAAREANTKHRSRLVEMISIGSSAERAFERELSKASATTRTAFEKLVARPDLMTTLSEHMHMTVVVGNRYRDDPAGVLDEARTHHDQLARADRDADREWRDEIERDPEALAELQASAKAYADEYGYSDGYQDGYADGADDTRDHLEHDPAQCDHASHSHGHSHLHDPYWYWWGFPAWHAARFASIYTSPFAYHFGWYRLPIWYHTGFHFGFGSYGRTIHVVRRPSRHYGYWHNRFRRDRAPRITRHLDRRFERDRRFRRASLRNDRIGRRDGRFVPRGARPTLESELRRRRGLDRARDGRRIDRRDERRIERRGERRLERRADARIGRGDDRRIGRRDGERRAGRSEGRRIDRRDGRNDRQIDRRSDRRVDRRDERRVDRRRDIRVDRRSDRNVDRRVDRRGDRVVDRQIRNRSGNPKAVRPNVQQRDRRSETRSTNRSDRRDRIRSNEGRREQRVRPQSRTPRVERPAMRGSQPRSNARPSLRSELSRRRSIGQARRTPNVSSGPKARVQPRAKAQRSSKIGKMRASQGVRGGGGPRMRGGGGGGKRMRGGGVRR